MTRRIVAVYGTRPEAIKLAPIVAARTEGLEMLSVVTGQHQGMLTQVHDVFGIVPHTDLGLFRPDGRLNDLAARTLSALSPCLRALAPDAVLVQGDTTSALAAALTAFYERIPVFHLEAGLRTPDISSPYPEEGNRRLITQIAALHLAPTAGAAANLRRTGIPADDIVVTGNTVIDALHTALERVDGFAEPALAQRDADRPVILVTSHRRESWGEPMRRTAQALKRIAERYPATDLVLPLHANPAVREIFISALSEEPNIILTDSLAYPDMCQLLQQCVLVITDSGGLQEEAPALGKPVLVLREETERPEAVEAGVAELVGTEPDRIAAAVSALLDDAGRYARMSTAVNPFGDGRAAERALAAIRAYFSGAARPDEFRP